MYLNLNWPITKQHSIAAEEVSAFTIILIILGAFMFVNSLIGCYGAITENATQLLIVSIRSLTTSLDRFHEENPFLSQFSVFLFICIFFEMGTIIAAGENKQRLNQYVPMKLSDTLAGSNTTESYRSAWDFLQSEVSSSKKKRSHFHFQKD